MAVTADFDHGSREALAEALQLSSSLVDLGCLDEQGASWRMPTWSSASAERIAIDTPPYLLNQLQASSGPMGTNLALTQSRAMLMEAAGALMGVGLLTKHPDESTRASSIGPLARACTERAATVHWVLSGEGRDGRLLRSLLVEFAGIERLLRLLPKTRVAAHADDVKATRAELRRIARHRFGSCSSDGLTISGQKLPSLSSRVREAATPFGYAELSINAHPTGHRLIADGDLFIAATGHIVAPLRSTLHDEGRLCESALLSFCRALEKVAEYLGHSDVQEVRAWAMQILTIWNEWCTQNGCG